MEMLNQSRRAVGGAILAAAVAVAGCSSSGPADSPVVSGGGSTTHSGAAAFPVTVHLANGAVTIASKPTAIVSLSPTATEMLFAIGAGSQVKAVDKNSDYPPAAPHTKIDAYQLNVEAVAAYQPDLVVASDLTAAQTKQLATLHIPTLLTPAATNLAQAYQQIAQLGQATGHTDAAAAEVRTMKQQIATLVSGSHKPATYYYELDQTYYSETSSTFIGQVLKLLGLRSIADSAKGAAASGGYPQLSAEFILKANPDYVFLADTKCCKQSQATVAERPGWSTLAAVRAGRVVELNDDIASRWGPRIVDLLRVVANALKQHPVT
jgi:iron complex transport system substrate-binding protein